ncbi:hypothetical protein HDU96_003085, partial [Phlyctochytrium bullatum]
GEGVALHVLDHLNLLRASAVANAPWLAAETPGGGVGAVEAALRAHPATAFDPMRYGVAGTVGTEEIAAGEFRTANQL